MKKLLAIVIVCGILMALSACKTNDYDLLFSHGDSSATDLPKITTSKTASEHSFDNTTKSTTVITSGSMSKTNRSINHTTIQSSVNGIHKHVYTKKVVPATCTARGYTIYNCACGDSYQSDWLESVAHMYVDGKCKMCKALDFVNPKENLKFNTNYAYHNSSEFCIFVLNFSSEEEGTLISYWYTTDGSPTSKKILLDNQTYYIGGVGGPYIYAELTEKDIAIKVGFPESPVYSRIVVQHDGMLRGIEGGLKDALFTTNVVI